MFLFFACLVCYCANQYFITAKSCYALFALRFAFRPKPIATTVLSLFLLRWYLQAEVEVAHHRGLLLCRFLHLCAASVLRLSQKNYTAIQVILSLFSCVYCG